MSILVKARRFKKEVAIGATFLAKLIHIQIRILSKIIQLIFINHLDTSVLHLAFFNSKKDESCIKRSALI